MKRPVKRGRLVLLTIPMPRQLRCFDHSEEQYRIWGLVRRCLPAVGEEAGYAVGSRFYREDPLRQVITRTRATLYDITHREVEGLWHLEKASLAENENDVPNDNRRQTRFSIPETIFIEALDANGNVEKSETTVTENLSVGGRSTFHISAGAAWFVPSLTCAK